MGDSLDDFEAMCDEAGVRDPFLEAQRRMSSVKCGTHPDYLVPGCDDCVRSGYAKQFAKDKRDVQAGLDIDHGLGRRTIDFLESLGRWTMDKKRCLSFAQRRRLDEILGEHYGLEE